MNDNDLIKRSDVIEAIERIDWYHQNRNKDMVSGANPDEHQAWYKAEDIYNALKSVPQTDEPNLILPKQMKRGEWYQVGDTIVVMNRDDYYDLLCKSYKPQDHCTKGKRSKWYCPECKRIYERSTR